MCYRILEPLSNVSKSYEGKISYSYVVVAALNSKYNATNFINFMNFMKTLQSCLDFWSSLVTFLVAFRFKNVSKLVIIIDIHFNIISNK